MTAAAEEERIDMEMEKLLGQFEPAEVPEGLIERIDAAMTAAAEEERIDMEMEKLLGQFEPAEVPEGLIERIDAAMTAAAEEERIDMEMEKLLGQFEPAEVPEGLIERIDAAMTAAAEEERIDMEMEKLLGRFEPAEVPEGLIERIDAAMTAAAEEERTRMEIEAHIAAAGAAGGYERKRRNPYWLSGVVTVAASVAFLAVLPFFAVADNPDDVKKSREVIECKSLDLGAENDMQELQFEDCMQLDVEGTETIIRVPVSDETIQEEDYL